MRFRLTENNIPLLATALVCVSLFAAGGLRYPHFASVDNVVNLLIANAYVGVVAVGMTFVILSGGIDLSVGSVAGLAGVAIGWAVQKHAVHPMAAIAAALAFGALFGTGMGGLIHFFRLPAFLVTLAGMFLARGLGFVISLESLPYDHPFFDRMSAISMPLVPGGGIGLPVTSIVFLVVLAAGIYLAHLTSFGRNVYALGGNEQSALLMGVPVSRTKVLIYALSGFCAALGGVLLSVGTMSGNPNAGMEWELRAIAAVVIGGTLLTGGAGYVLGTLLGVLILGLIETALDFEGKPGTGWNRVAIGMLLFLFIALQRLIAWTSAGGAGWLTRRRRGFEVPARSP
jgi:ribose/xylose/arabinose/galactoside ABC-type transport system permease subunit